MIVSSEAGKAGPRRQRAVTRMHALPKKPLRAGSFCSARIVLLSAISVSNCGFVGMPA